LKSSYLKTLVLAVIVVGSVIAFWFGLRAALGTEYPFLTVASGSMKPTLNVGDLIVVQGISNYSEVKAALQPEGDIIVFRRPPEYGPDELIVHRAISKFQGDDGLWYFRTQGDYNAPPGVLSPDPWTIPQSSVVGRVIGWVPWLGYVPLYIRTPWGLVIIVILVIIIIFSEYIPMLFRKKPQSQG